MSVRTESGALIRYAGRALVQNQHGIARLKPTDRYLQAIALSPDDGVPSWWWYCETAEPGVKGAPQVYVGTNPYSNQGTGFVGFPAALEKIDKLTIAYEADVFSTGRCNVAFDAWVVNEAEAPYGEAAIAAEVMVALAWRGGWPTPAGGEELGVVSLPFVGDARVRRFLWHTYPSFLVEPVKASPTLGIFNLGLVLDFLREDVEAVRGQDYLAAVQLMTEVVDGVGICRVPTFEPRIVRVKS